MAIVDLSQLAAPDVVEEVDYEMLLAERKATFVSLFPEAEQEAIARTLTLESEPGDYACRRHDLSAHAGCD